MAVKISAGIFVRRLIDLRVILMVAALLSCVNQSSGSNLSNPCRHNTQEKLRHQRSADNKAIVNLINISFGKTKEQLNHLQKMYFKNHTLYLGDKTFPGLNISKMIRSIRRTKNYTTQLTRLYRHLQVFGKSLMDLRKMKLVSQVQFGMHKRAKILNETFDSLLAIMCETLHHNVKKMKRTKTLSIPKVGDFTLMSAVDIAFYKNLKKYLKKAEVALTMTKKRGRRRNSPAFKKTHRRRN